MPADLREKAQEAKHILLEKLADADDDIMEKFLEEKEISPNDIHAAIRRAVVKNAFLPVMVGTALRNRGVQMVLDAITEYLPSPLDVPPVKGIDPKTEEYTERATDSEAPLSALVFKIASDPYVGKLYYARIYSGSISAGETIYNSSQRIKERVSKIVVMHSNKQEIAPKVGAGEIVALVGLKGSKSGDTICDAKAQIIIESMKVPEPVEIVMGNTGIVANTKAAVEGVRERRERQREKYDRIFEDATNLVHSAKDALLGGRWEEVGRYMDRNHELLQEIGVSSKELDFLVEVARDNGAYGAKMTGGGLGGYMVALTPGKDIQEEVARAIEKEGFYVLRTRIGV